LVEEELGIKDGISVLHLSLLLYIAYFHWLFTSFPTIAKSSALNMRKKARRAAIKIMKLLKGSTDKTGGL